MDHHLRLGCHTTATFLPVMLSHHESVEVLTPGFSRSRLTRTQPNHTVLCISFPINVEIHLHLGRHGMDVKSIRRVSPLAHLPPPGPFRYFSPGTIKDAVTRYAHQSGHHVSRRAGWDCHGLPVEYEIDQSLKITHRNQVCLKD